MRARELGPAVLVRAIETLGTTMVEMRLSPDPRILAEVALVQLTNDEAGTDVDALLARIERLENTVKQLREEGPGRRVAGHPGPRSDDGRAVLGGAKRANPPAVARTRQPAPIGRRPHLPRHGPTAPVTVPEAEQTVKGQVKPIMRALYSAGSFVGSNGEAWQFSVPNEAHGATGQEHRAAVEAALSKAVGAPVKSRSWIGGRAHDDEPAPVARHPAPAPAHDPAVEEIDLSELTDAPPESVRTPIDRLAEAFPGSEFVTEELSRSHHAASPYTQPVQALIDELGRLPGIGPKSAQRIAFHLLKVAPEDANRLAHAIREAKEKVRFCERCFNVADAALCPICADDRRDPTVVCVVEESRDIVSIERTGEFRPLPRAARGDEPTRGHRPRAAQDPELNRLGPEGIQEVIVCTNPNTEGEVTAMYLARMLKPLGLKVTRTPPACRSAATSSTPTSSRRAGLEGRRTIDA